MSAEQLRQALEDAAVPEEPAVGVATDGGPDWRVEVARLAALAPVEADRAMEAAAGKLGCLVSTLRDEVKRKRTELRGFGAESSASGRSLDLEEPEPWHEPVVGTVLLDGLADTFDRYLALPAHGATKLSLWTVHTHAHGASFITPRLAITSVQKGCGKTTVLDLLSGLVPKPLQAANVTAAAVFRTIEAKRPTLLVDEADTFLAENEELRGVLNSGHTRSGAVIRVVEHEGDFEPRQFSTWAPVAIAKIGKLPGTLEDRSVKLEMRRALPGEVKQRLRRDRLDQFQDLARRCARWAADNMAKLAEADPTMPPSVANRLADNWRPLLAIADRAGGEWPQKARAALAAEQAEASDSALAVVLLEDLRDLFVAADAGKPKPAEKLPSTYIIAELAKLEHRPWGELGKSRKPITTHKLAGLLAPFGIGPKHEETGNVYHRARFADAWGRYLGEPRDSKASELQESNADKHLASRQSFRNGTAPEGSSEPKNPAITMPPEGLKVRHPGNGDCKPWTDDRSWIAQIRDAKRHDDRVSILLAWGEAAGADISCVGESVALVLPSDLPRGMALTELRRVARDLHVEVSTGGRA